MVSLRNQEKSSHSQNDYFKKINCTVKKMELRRKDIETQIKTRKQ